MDLNGNIFRWDVKLNIHKASSTCTVTYPFPVFRGCLQDEAQTLLQAGYTGPFRPFRPLPVSPASLFPLCLPTTSEMTAAPLTLCFCPAYGPATHFPVTQNLPQDLAQTPPGHHPRMGPSMLPISTLMLVNDLTFLQVCFLRARAVFSFFLPFIFLSLLPSPKEVLSLCVLNMQIKGGQE